jgi:deaminated glutathione amidase
VDPWGTVLAQQDQLAGVVSGVVDPQRLRDIRLQLPALSHRVL